MVGKKNHPHRANLAISEDRGCEESKGVRAVSSKQGMPGVERRKKVKAPNYVSKRKGTTVITENRGRKELHRKSAGGDVKDLNR